MESIITINQSAKITDKQLQSLTDKIAKAANAMKANILNIGALLIEVKESKVYKQDFKTFDEYTENVLGLKKSQRARIMLTASKLAVNGELPKELENLKNTQLTAIAEKVETVEEAVELVKSGKITPDMNVKETVDTLNGKQVEHKKKVTISPMEKHRNKIVAAIKAAQSELSNEEFSQLITEINNAIHKAN